MFKKTLTKVSSSWNEKYLEGMEQTVEQYKKLQDVEYILDVPFESQDDATLAMDLFCPLNKGSALLPVVMMVHGGGFIMGDRRMEMGICRHFARAGFLSASLEYRSFPETDIRGAILDVAGGMEAIGRLAQDYGGDPDRIFLVSESAGVYAGIFAAAMTGSDELAKALGGRNPGINIRAMAALSGMFYARRKDLIGMVMADNLIPKKKKDAEYAKLLNTELDEIVSCLPPIFLVSSKGDFLRKYTLDYADFLKEQKKKYRLVYYDKGKNLMHAFPSLDPENPESIAADRMIVQWFAEHGAFQGR